MQVDSRRAALPEQPRDGLPAARAPLADEREPCRLVVITQHPAGDNFKGPFGAWLSVSDVAAVQTQHDLAGGRAAAGKRVKSAMHRKKKGTLKSGS